MSATVEVFFNAIPDALKRLSQWVAWKSCPDSPKPRKVPIDVKTGRDARANAPETWATFDEAVAFYRKWAGREHSSAGKRGTVSGLGFEFSEQDPFAGVDLDNCIEGEALQPWAKRIIDALDSYTELSPSRKGVHIIVRGKLPPGGKRRGSVEMYDSGRYFTMTGAVLAPHLGAIQSREAELHQLHAETFPKADEDTAKTPPRTESSRTHQIDEAFILEHAARARNGDVFKRLWAGDTAGYTSHSDADLALCNILAFWTRRDAGLMDALFRRSGLMRPKWDKIHRPADGATFGRMTIEKAIASCRDVYTPREPQPSPPALPGSSSRPGDVSLASIELISASDLSRLQLPEVTWMIPQLIPEGLTLLVGRPKMGKSWLTLNLGVAVASGGKFLGNDASRGRVLYLALEDSKARLKARINQVCFDCSVPDLLVTATEWPRLDQGGMSLLHQYLGEYPDTRLIVIDTLAKVRPAKTDRSKGVYENDYDFIGQLKQLADASGIGVVLVHHKRKVSGDDPLDDVSGSTGLTGAADTIIIVDRKRGTPGAVMRLTGRDIEEQELAIEFDRQAGTWHCLGPAEDVALSQAQQEVLEILAQNPGGVSLKEIVTLTGKNKNNIHKLLGKLVTAGKASQSTLRGVYYPILPPTSPSPTTFNKSKRERNSGEYGGQGKDGIDGELGRYGELGELGRESVSDTNTPNQESFAVHPCIVGGGVRANVDVEPVCGQSSPSTPYLPMKSQKQNCTDDPATPHDAVSHQYHSKNTASKGITNSCTTCAEFTPSRMNPTTGPGVCNAKADGRFSREPDSPTCPMFRAKAAEGGIT